MQDGGFNDPKATTVALKMFPNSISTKELAHYGEIMLEDKFEEWKGCSLNENNAPVANGKEIQLTNITQMPVGLFIGEYDKLGTPEINAWLAPQLGNLVHNQIYADMGHGSFLIGKNMSYVDNLINLVKQYNH